MNGTPDSWVTVAKAAAALSAAGDRIDASNVSRYLARFPEIPSRKDGKFRFVDLAALKAHRATNVLVGDKRVARELTAEPRPSPQIARRVEDAAEEDEGGAAGQPGSALSEANLRLKLIRIRDEEIDLFLKEGSLIPAEWVGTALAEALQAVVAELERQETAIAAAHGRVIAAEFRKARKEAQAKGAARLREFQEAALRKAADLPKA